MAAETPNPMDQVREALTKSQTLLKHWYNHHPDVFERKHDAEVERVIAENDAILSSIATAPPSGIREALEKLPRFNPYGNDMQAWMEDEAGGRWLHREAVFQAVASIPGGEPAYPLIQLGYGQVEVGEGHLDGVPALIFGRNGTGLVGEATKGERYLNLGETLAVVTFQNVASLDVVLSKLGMLREKMAPAAPTETETPIPEDIAAELTRADWTPEEALRFYAAGRHFDVVQGRTRILDAGAIASNALKALSHDYAESKGDVALMESPAIPSGDVEKALDILADIQNRDEHHAGDCEAYARHPDAVIVCTCGLTERLDSLRAQLTEKERELAEYKAAAGWLADVVIREKAGTPDKEAWIRRGVHFYNQALEDLATMRSRLGAVIESEDAKRRELVGYWRSINLDLAAAMAERDRRIAELRKALGKISLNATNLLYPREYLGRVAEEALADAASPQGEAEPWVRVSDQLPVANGRVIVAFKDGYRREANYRNGTFYDTYSPDSCGPYSFTGVTHWMPLPSPPAGDTQKGGA